MYSERVMGPEHVENVAELACRSALAYRGVGHINIPTDVQDQKCGERSRKNVPGHVSLVGARSGGVPAEAELRRAAEPLNSGRKIVILAGQGALDARQKLEMAAAATACAGAAGHRTQRRPHGPLSNPVPFCLWPLQEK